MHLKSILARSKVKMSRDASKNRAVCKSTKSGAYVSKLRIICVTSHTRRGCTHNMLRRAIVLSGT